MGAIGQTELQSTESSAEEESEPSPLQNLAGVLGAPDLPGEPQRHPGCRISRHNRGESERRSSKQNLPECFPQVLRLYHVHFEQDRKWFREQKRTSNSASLRFSKRLQENDICTTGSRTMRERERGLRGLKYSHPKWTFRRNTGKQNQGGPPNC